MDNPNEMFVKLQSFANYCELNPQLRFWQALRNWNQMQPGNSKKNFILTAEIDNKGDKNWVNEEDTFYQ